ncbi:MAG: hypothetical protein KDC04_01495 [Saprospiraceae bacterium]|nr:hypothetical protein [Saprospiraceae bacterium]MCB9310473.1 hypothetical protein [Lewinellaceae bacterium]
MQFELIRKDRLEKSVVSKNTPFTIHHFKREGSDLHKVEDLPFLLHRFPDEELDGEMRRFPSHDKVNYGNIFGMQEGYMPSDLTPTETILTKMLWGEMDMDYTALLVAGVENMDLEDIYINYKKMKLM